MTFNSFQDSGKKSCKRNSVDVSFEKAMTEAEIAYTKLRADKAARDYKTRLGLVRSLIFELYIDVLVTVEPTTFIWGYIHSSMVVEFFLKKLMVYYINITMQPKLCHGNFRREKISNLP